MIQFIEGFLLLPKQRFHISTHTQKALGSALYRSQTLEPKSTRDSDDNRKRDISPKTLFFQVSCAEQIVWDPNRFQCVFLAGSVRTSSFFSSKGDSSRKRGNTFLCTSNATLGPCWLRRVGWPGTQTHGAHEHMYVFRFVCAAGLGPGPMWENASQSSTFNSSHSTLQAELQRSNF